jgi:nitrate reductase NapD
MQTVDRDRRRFLKGQSVPDGGSLLISSAIVTAFPDDAPAVAERIATLPGVEVHAVAGSRIIIVMEGRESGEIGARLAEIALMEGVLAANMVYEHAARLAEGGDDAANPA